MGDVVIIKAVRTAIGSYGGSLKDLPAADLASILIQLSEDTDFAGETMRILGNVLQAACGQNRRLPPLAGVPASVPAYTVNKVCGSGLKTVGLAAQAIRAGDGDIYVVGGMENMSRAPYAHMQSRWGARMGHTELKDVMIEDGLWCAFNDVHMGITAENIADRWSISRSEQDVLPRKVSEVPGRSG